MARILAAIVLAIAGSISLSAGALGLGEIDLKSALNQPFNAEISVVSEAPDELEALNVVIASVETFEQFGLDRAAFLTDFEFSVVNSGGAGMVQITSRRPIVEPFVTLLLKVSWPQGRLLREYTVLLDPPVFATESVKSAVATPTAGPSTSTPREELVPAKSTGIIQPQAAQPVEQPVGIAQAGGTYGPVQRNDTLWSIAGKMMGESTVVSRNQMMLAIYQANPEAFAGNINRLKAGMILRVPTADDLVLGTSDATAEVQRQNKEWQGDAGRDEAQGGRLRLVPPPDRDSEAAPGVQVDAGEGQSATGDGEDALQGRVSQLESDLVESQRQLQVRDQELQALQQQLAEISRQSDAASVSSEPEPGSEIDTPAMYSAQPPRDSVAAPALAEDTPVEQETVPAGDQAAAPIDVTPVPIEREDESFLGALFTNPLVYISLAIVLLLAWVVARNRSKSAESLADQWEGLDEEVPEEAEHEAATRLQARPPEGETFVVEESPQGEATDEGSIETFTGEPSEEWGGLIEEGETPLERTISTDSAVNLDQADPIAEADFHMAYGLYDQAADLLTRVLESEPERKDLRVKLLEVFFIWENQDGFLQEAGTLQQQINDATDPDWNKVLIMGKQICPDEALFAGEAAPVSMSEGVDLDFSEGGDSEVIDIVFDDDSASSIDLDFGDADESLDLDLAGDDQDGGSDLLDFDIGAEDEDDDVEMSGETPTMETPTLEAPAMDDDSASTMESPTLESPVMDDDSASTMETPTIESPIGAWDEGSLTDSGQADEIKLDDLDVDLSSLDDVDSGESEFAAADQDQQPDELFDVGSDDVSSLDELAADESDAIEDFAELQTGDTVEQPSVSVQDTAEQPELNVQDTVEQPVGQPALKAVDDDFVHEIGEPLIDDNITDQVEGVGGDLETATMTEVDTKLDLARAYIDMGDPGGARSILDEVLEEADEGQRQEAQKLLDDLAG